jgi:hypothetical protein
MSEPGLHPDDLSVESFETTAPVAERPPTGMQTYEPGCTTPDLCPIGYAAAPMKTYEPGCTTLDLCPIG